MSSELPGILPEMSLDVSGLSASSSKSDTKVGIFVQLIAAERVRVSRVIMMICL